MTARDNSTAKGTARFFAVLRGSPALFCGVGLIDWTTVEVCVMVDDRRVLAKREHWHEAALHAGEVRTPGARRRRDITKATTYPRTRRLEVALERRRVLGVVAPGPRPRLHHRVEEVPLEEPYTVSEGRLLQVGHVVS